MSIITEVFATDRRIVGIALQTPFTDEEYQQALARVRAVTDREGGTDNATITVDARKERPGVLDIKATWEGFIAPAAEQHRVWSDADSSFGRERVVLGKLTRLAKDLAGDKVSQAKVQEIIDWMEVD